MRMPRASVRMLKRLNAIPPVVFAVLLTAITGIGTSASAQCVVINEIMINPQGPCDGACSPHTEEWVELYNTCNVSVNIGCYVIGDGDFTVTIPAGTILPPHGHYTIGSSNSGAGIDLNIATCGCTTGSGIGVFSNSNEQVVLASNTGALQDAVVWGGGAFPAYVNSTTFGTCTGVSLAFPNGGGGVFEGLPSPGGQGCSLARACDGSSLWEERCGSTVSLGDSNGAPVDFDIDSPEVVICPGECVDFAASAEGPVEEWTWTFPGSEAGEASGAFPDGICYAAPGVYDVILTAATACGEISLTGTEWVIVEPVPAAPVISAAAPGFLCGGGALTLSATPSTGFFQWFLNGQPIAGASGPQYAATQTGAYTVRLSNGFCEAFSEEWQLTAGAISAPALTAEQSFLCAGQSLILNATEGYEVYEWLLDGETQPGLTTPQVSVTLPGTYTVQVYIGSCTALSNSLDVEGVDTPDPDFNASGPVSFCEGGSVVLTASPGFEQYQWLLNDAPVPGATNQSVVADTGGTFVVRVLENGCFGESLPVVVTEWPLPSIALSESGTVPVCVGESVNLEATANGSVSWYFNSVFLGNGGQWTFSEGGIAAALVTDVNGCAQWSADVTISPVTPEPVAINAGQESADVCDGDVLTLFAPGDWLQIEWSHNGEPVSSEETFGASEGGLYEVSVLSGAGCAASDDFFLDVLDVPTPQLSPGGDLVLCHGESVILSSAAQGALQWLSGGVPVPGATSAALEVTLAGEYAVMETAPNGCSGESTPVQVVVSPAIQAVIQVSPNAPCAGETALLSVPGNWPEINWLGHTSGLTLSVTGSGLYQAEVVNGFGCADTVSATVEFAAMPTADAGEDVIADCGASFTLYGEAAGGEVSWSPVAGLDDPHAMQPAASPRKPTTYVLTVTNGRCVARDEVIVLVNCGNLYVPNAFTPDGDGLNEAFRPVADEALDWHLVILDRWGTVVFESEDQNTSWTGNVRGGDHFAPDGVYVWRLSVRFEDSPAEEVHHGFVTMVR
jgi:gliding motility-associated-like protein